MKRLGLVLGSAALCLSLASFILGSAPFAPALALVFVALPLALVSAFLGSRRVAAVTLYFSVASWLVMPLAQALSFRLDALLVILGIIGAAIGGVLIYGAGQDTCKK